jgi:hypothetical protein
VFKFFSDVQGYDLISKEIEKLIAKGSKTAAKSGLSKGMTIIARGIRKEIPPKAKSVKKTVGQRFVKGKGSEKHKFEAKVGLGVGKKTKSKKERDPSRPGVGISKENVHWWELGTKKRFRKTEDGKLVSTGRVRKGPPVVREGFHATKNEARAVIIATIKAKIKAEVKKKKARAKAKAKGK